MATIGALIGSAVATDPAHTLLPPGNIGIELELEGREEWPSVAGWRKEADGSLRDGIEYVFDGPKGGALALRNIKNMASMLKEYPVDNSFRCSTHIHLDVRDMDFEQLKRLVIAYSMMEGVMFQHCAVERRYSNFCTPFFLNTWLPRLFAGYLADERDTHRLHNLGAWPKYSALNLKPVTQYGSVEFRGSHALTTEAELLGLAQRMLHLKRVALGANGTALEFTEQLRNLRLEEIFPTGLAQGFLADEKMLDQGYSTAIGIATGNTARRRATTYAQLAEERAAPYADHTLPMNPAAMERYHLFNRTAMRLSELMQMVKSLRQVQGLERPELHTFVAGAYRHDWGMFGGANNVIAAMRSLGINNRELGL